MNYISRLQNKELLSDSSDHIPTSKVQLLMLLLLKFEIVASLHAIEYHYLSFKITSF